MSESKEGDLRVWWLPQMPCESFNVPVEDIKQAKFLLDALAKYDIFQFERNMKGFYANAGGLELFVDREWIEWQSDDGLEIDDVDENGAEL